MAEEKETQAAPAKNCSCASDLRTFVIALLTALIVVSLYHLGTGYCRMRAALNRRAAADRARIARPMLPPPCRCAMPGCRMNGAPKPCIEGKPCFKGKPGFEGKPCFEGKPGFEGKPCFEGKPGFEGRHGRRHFRPGDKPAMPKCESKPAAKPAEAPKAPAPAPDKAK